MSSINKSYIFQGLAFTLEERQILGIHGHMPARVKTEEEQVEHALILLDRLDNDLDKYIYLIGLLDRNERLFFKVISSDVGKMMPLVYTPTVGLACQKYSLIFQQPKGLFITIHDKGHVYDILKVCFFPDLLIFIFYLFSLFSELARKRCSGNRCYRR